MIGPPPPTNDENAGASSVGLTTMTPIARNAMVPIFMNVLRYPRGVSSIQTGSTDPANPYIARAAANRCRRRNRDGPAGGVGKGLPRSTAKDIQKRPATDAFPALARLTTKT